MPGPQDIRLPVSLAWLREVEDGRAWLSALPALIAEACSLWSLELGEPYEGSHVSLVLPAERDGASPLVLKLQFPHSESDHEAVALRVWDGNGAVRLIDHAPDISALLLDRCVPGTHLADAGSEAAIPVLATLVRRLCVAMTEPFTALADEARRWADNLQPRWEEAGRPFELHLIERAIELLRALAETQGEQVLVHQDLHAHNVLRAERGAWLAIDPKPVHGEIEFALAPIVRSFELGHSRQDVLHRLDQLSDLVGVDRARARDWCFAQTVAWSIEGRACQRAHVETARWLLTA